MPLAVTDAAPLHTVTPTLRLLATGSLRYWQVGSPPPQKKSGAGTGRGHSDFSAGIPAAPRRGVKKLVPNARASERRPPFVMPVAHGAARGRLPVIRPS